MGVLIYPIILIGPMGSGKSTIGRLLAARLACPCVDLDAEIVKQAGKTIPQIFAEDGEPAFRSLESELLRDFCIHDDEKKILATGGGVILDPLNRACIKQTGVVVWLDASPEVLARRISGDRNRPLLSGVDPLVRAKELDLQRRAYYESCADVRMDTSVMRSSKAMHMIVQYLKEQ